MVFQIASAAYGAKAFYKDRKALYYRDRDDTVVWIQAFQNWKVTFYSAFLLYIYSPHAAIELSAKSCFTIYYNQIVITFTDS